MSDEHVIVVFHLFQIWSSASGAAAVAPGGANEHRKHLLSTDDRQHTHGEASVRHVQELNVFGKLYESLSCLL